MALSSETNPADLCRVCIQNVTYVPSANIFESGSDSDDQISIYRKLSTICSEVFAPEPQDLSLPLNVCRECQSRINEAYELHRMCLENHRMLQEMLLGSTPEVVITNKEELGEDGDQSELARKPAKETKVYAESLDALLDAAFPSENGDQEVKNHEMKKGSQIFRCEKCGFVTRFEHAFHKHKKMKHPKDVFQCDKCYEVYFDKAKLEHHRKNHDLAKPFACPNCPKRFKRRRDVTLHANLCQGHTPYLCTECGKSYAYHSSLVQHLVRHKARAFACGQCPVKFHTKGALKTHVTITHKKEKNFSCDQCEKRFVTNDSLKKHLMSHSDERRYTCDICNMSFKRPNNRMRHMRTHTGEKPYKCTHCDRAFSQTNDLLKHSKTHFGDNPYKCDRCEESFRLLSHLRDHYQVHYQSGGAGSQEEDSDLPETFQFNIVSILKRRAEQERQKEHQNDQ